MARDSVLRRRSPIEAHRSGAAQAANARTGMDIELHLALEHHRAFDHRTRADHDSRNLLLAQPEAHPALVRLVDPDPALYMRTRTHGDVPIDGLDVARHGGFDDADGAIHGFDVPRDLAAAIDENPAVDGLDVAVDLRAFTHMDAAVDRAQRSRLDIVLGADAAVDGFRVFDVRLRLDSDAAVDGAQVAIGLAGVGGDGAVDLVDALAVTGCIVGDGRARKGGATRQSKKGGEQKGTVHAELRGVLQAVMRPMGIWFTCRL